MKKPNKNQYEIKVPKRGHDSKFIELPYYSKNAVYAFKVISQELCIIVEYASTQRGIQSRSTEYSTAFSDLSSECTEEEFWMLYNQVKEELYNLAIGKEVTNESV